jgi:hypothetical protein
MLTRSEQELAREWLQITAAGDNTVDAKFAVDVLNWLQQLIERNCGPMVNPTQMGPMLQIRVRGPLSISEIKPE